MSERTLEKCNREEGKRDLCAEIRNCRRRTASLNKGRDLGTEDATIRCQKWISARMAAITKLWTRSPYGEGGQPFSKMDFRADGRDHKIEGAFSVRRRRSSVQKRPFPFCSDLPYCLHLLEDFKKPEVGPYPPASAPEA